MTFIKQNLFLIVVGAVLVILVGFVLGLAYTFGSQADAYARLRTDESQKLRGLASSEVNGDVVAAAEKKVGMVQKAASEMREFCLKRNSTNYPVIAFNIAGKPVQAFPIDQNLYRQEALRWRFPHQYRKALLELLESLQPASPPTEPEIKDEETRLAQKLGVAAPDAGFLNLGQSAQPWSGTSTGYPERIRPEDFDMRGRRDWQLPSPSSWGQRTRPETGTTTQPGEGPAKPNPRQMAEQNLIWAKSQQGSVYAGERSLHMQLVPTESRSDYPDDALWMAQVGLWVQKDIVAAINQTNREAQQEAPVQEAKGVPSSAIKRLVSTHVRGYVVNSAGGDQPGRREGLSPAGAALMYVDAWSSSAGSPPSLTGRACSKLYDVVHYDFTVVLPARYLRRLYRNLRLQNFHTVLDVRVSPPTGESESEILRSSAKGQEWYYYGTDPVVQATITGELLLLTEWSRPLMPEEFLKKIGRANPDSLRPEDTQRVGPIAAPTPTPGVTPTPVPGQRPEPEDEFRRGMRPDDRLRSRT